jgi:hypothetical protein
LPHMSFTERKVLALSLKNQSRFGKDDKYLMKTMPSFDGDAAKAIVWWNVFLKKCATYRCTSEDALELMKKKLEGTRAQSWYASVIGKMGGQEPDTIIVAMLHDFRAVYMGEVQQRMYEEQVMKIKCADSFTHAIVEAHWSRWSAVASAWRACGDVPVTEKKVIMTYYLSLPSELRARVQPEWLNSCATVEALHAYMLTSAQLNPHARAATTTFNALTTRINSLEQQLAHASLSHSSTSTHLNTVSQSQSTAVVPYASPYAPTYPYTQSAPGGAQTFVLDHIAFMNAAPTIVELNAYINKNQSYDKKYVRCFHCGENHYLYECDRAKQRLPQTQKGALAWNEYARMRGISVVYDVEAWFTKFAGPRYEHIRNARAR